jgi:hypothetical protein
MAKQLIAAGEQVPAAQLIIQAHEAAKQEHREAEMKLDAHKERVTTMNKLHHESSTEKEMIANELGNVNRMHEDVGKPAVAVARLPCRLRQLDASMNGLPLLPPLPPPPPPPLPPPPPPPPPPAQPNVNKKEEGTPMAEHAGQWLYEKGMVYWDGLNLKIKDQNRGQLMVEASASSGFPLVEADCHYLGWNGTEKDFNKAV